MLTQIPVNTILTHMFTAVDDFCKQVAHPKPGPVPRLCDSELITILLFGELLGLASERKQHRYAMKYLRDYFPGSIDQSGFHRRALGLTGVINQCRAVALQALAPLVSDLHLLDSTPVPVIAFPRAHLTPLFPEATYGRCAARNLMYRGFKLFLVTDQHGIPLHFELVPAHVPDVEMTEEMLLARSQGHHVLADGGFLSATIQAALREQHGIVLDVPKRRNQKSRESRAHRKLMNRFRQLVETMNGSLKATFSLEKTYAKTLAGLVARIVRKITALTFALFLNHSYDRPLRAVASLVC